LIGMLHLLRWGEPWLIRILEHRIGEERIIRPIRKCLKAGIFEDGILRARRAQSRWTLI
jgi:hypothetical protein